MHVNTQTACSFSYLSNIELELQPCSWCSQRPDSGREGEAPFHRPFTVSVCRTTRPANMTVPEDGQALDRRTSVTPAGQWLQTPKGKGKVLARPNASANSQPAVPRLTGVSSL